MRGQALSCFGLFTYSIWTALSQTLFPINEGEGDAKHSIITSSSSSVSVQASSSLSGSLTRGNIVVLSCLLDHTTDPVGNVRAASFKVPYITTPFS